MPEPAVASSETVISEWRTEFERIFTPEVALSGVGTPELKRLAAAAMGKPSIEDKELQGFLLEIASAEDDTIADVAARAERRALAIGACAWLFIPSPEPEEFDRFYPMPFIGGRVDLDSLKMRQSWAYFRYRRATLKGARQETYGHALGMRRREQFRDALIAAVSRHLRATSDASGAQESDRSRWERIRQRIGRPSRLQGVALSVVAVGLVAAVIAIGLRWQEFVVPSNEPTANTAVEVDEPGVNVAAQSSGPVRDEIAMAARNSQIVLNSIFDNPRYGDERNFVQIKVADDPDTAFTDTIALEPGQVYTVRIYIHNGASPSSVSSVATRTRLQVQAPGVVRGSTAITALLSADNASPTSVWDSVVAAAPSPDDIVALRYLSGSAALRLGDSGDSVPLSDELFLDGVLIGCGELDGELPPADECAGYVTFEFRVDQPNFTVETAARIAGSSSEYSSNLAVHPGDVVEVRIVYTNTGTTQQDNVSLRVMGLATELRYVSESTAVANSETGGVYETAPDGVTTVGYNAGSYQPRGNVYLKLLLQVDDEALVAAGPRWLSVSPFIRVTTSGGSKEANLTLTLLP